MMNKPLWLSLLFWLALCHGLVPLHRPVVNRGELVELNLFQTRKRVKKVYQSLKQRIQIVRHKQEATDHDRVAFVSAVQEQMNGDAFQIAVHANHFQNQFSQLLGNDTATYATSVATLEALKNIEESYVLVDVPTRMEQPSCNGQHSEPPVNCPANEHHIDFDPINCRVKPLKGHHPWNGEVLVNNGNSPTTNGKVEPTASGQHASLNNQAIHNQEDARKEPKTAVATTIPNPRSISFTATSPAHTNLYSLPPLHRQNLTKLELEFRTMLEYFCQFTPADLYTLRDPRVRAIMEGVISGSNEAPVYRAFEVLYEDLPPLRIAGRMIFAKLKDTMKSARAQAQQEVERLVETTGLSKETVQASRLAFLTLAIPTEQEFGNKEPHYLTVEQLVDTGLAEKARIALGHECTTEFLNRVNQTTGKVTFAGLLEGLQAAAEASCAVEHCDPAKVLQEVVQEMEPTLAHKPIKQLDKKRQEFSDQYDRMVRSFQEWDDIVPEGQGRRLDVLRGCFVGAANDRVVEALRVVYLDYAALRMAGNSIYALMKQVVTQIRRNRKSKNH